MTEYHLRRIEKCTNVNNRHCVIYQDNPSPIKKQPPPQKKSKLKNPKKQTNEKNPNKTALRFLNIIFVLVDKSLSWL